MKTNEEKNWWDEEFKPSLSQREWEDKIAELLEIFYHLTEKTFDCISKQEDEKTTKELILNYIKKIHKFVYDISLKENWMDTEFIKSMVENFYFSVNSSVFLLTNLNDDNNSFVDENSHYQIMLKKVKRQRFYQIKDLYINKLSEEISLIM